MQGLDEILATLSAMKEAVSPKNMKAIDMDAAKILLDEFRATAPVVSGRFRASAFLAQGTPSEPNVLFLIDKKICPYAGIVEFGYRKQKPHHTIQNAIDATQDEIGDSITESVDEALQGAQN